MTDQQRVLFEAAVVDRLKEGGFLEIEIRTECLVRCDEGYQDEVINAGWHYWNAATAAQPAPVDQPAAQIEFAKGTAGRENEMPRVVSCNWLPDGIYSVYLHPAPSDQPMGRWHPIEKADKSVDRVYNFPGMPRPISNSEEYWCRDADGRVFLATWADDGERAYWWDLEGESPVDPVEFMAHPLDPRFAAPADEHNCPVCLVAFKPDDTCATDIELGICHAECLEGTPVVDLDTGEPIPDGKVNTYRFSEVSDPPPAVKELEREPPELFSETERKEILADAEWLWKALQQNNLGGFSGINRPFYILDEFKRVIEKYGHRDVGLTWSQNDLDALPAPAEPTMELVWIQNLKALIEHGMFRTDERWKKIFIERLMEVNRVALAANPAPFNHVEGDSQPRYTTKRLHDEIAKAKAYARREALAEAAVKAHSLIAMDHVADNVRAAILGLEPMELLSPEQAWQELCETPDITSPEEYPDHALITIEQLADYMRRASMWEGSE